MLSHFASNPSVEHWGAVKRVFRYVRGSMDQGLVFRADSGTGIMLTGYSDAEWAGDLTTRKSVSGYLFLVAGGAVSWRSQRQPVVALSSTESEYIAMTTACKELVWLRQLLNDMGFPQDSPTVLFGDNQGALALVRNPVYHDRTKHIHVRYHYIRERVESGDITLSYCPTKDMLADAFTKAQGSSMFKAFKEAVSVV